MNTLENSSPHQSELAQSRSWIEARPDSDSLVPQEDKWLCSGWWFLPAALLGLVLWVILFRAVFGWLS